MGVAYSVGEVDHLYTFFVQWSPDAYLQGKKKRKKKRKKNCKIVKEENNSRHPVVDKMVTFISKLLSKSVNNPKSGEYLEIIKVTSIKRRLSLCNSVESDVDGVKNLDDDDDDVVPVLSRKSHLLEECHLRKLAAHMPPRTQGYPWRLVYSTLVHGTSLRTLYRNMAGLNGPVLLVVKDMHKKVFGAFSSDPFRISNYCYGTGETFLFTFSPDFQGYSSPSEACFAPTMYAKIDEQYRWSGENSYFVSGNLESLQIGGGGAGFALWLDADLYHGASFSCPTFHNPALSSQQDFIVQDVEVWLVQV